MKFLTHIMAMFFLPAAICAQEISFEKDIQPAHASKGSTVCLSDEHFKFGDKSLLWEWKRKGAQLNLNVDVPYMKENPNPKETSVSSFVFWVYSAQRQSGTITISFRKQGRECCHFDFNLGFTGWRGAWVAFDRDMEGQAESGMDEIVIQSSCNKGKLWFDGIIPAVFEDSRYHSPDFQIPFVNKSTDVHWLRLLEHWNTDKRLDVPASLPGNMEEMMETIRQRYISLVSKEAKGIKEKDARAFHDSFGIRKNNDGTICGKPVFFVRYAETYLNLGDNGKAEEYRKNGQLLRNFNDTMFRIAVSYLSEKEGDYKDYLGQIYIELTRHLLDQGMACGSGMGTIHHLGYSIRSWYNSQVLMMPLLKEAGLLEDVQQAMEWYAGTREVWTKSEYPGMDIDAFNTYLLGRMASILLLPDNGYKYAYMKALSDWVDNGFEYAPGLGACFKPDGTVFHHKRNYPAYAVGGFVGAVRSVWLLRGTDFAISEKGHEVLKNAMLQMRFYCNVTDVPFSMSGRHPEGSFTLNKGLYALLADAGSPDGKFGTDPQLSSAYLRLEGVHDTPFARKFKAEGIEAESSPQGCRSYGYNSSVSVRHGEWLVNIAGHSRYLWAAETYSKENLYGRYLTHGSLQYIKGSPELSGYTQKGWDWRHIPGTTAAAIPMEQMKAEVLNVDRFSGYEEMLLSDQWFAGGVAEGDYAVYSMILHEHDKYNGSLRARKSFFVFDNRIVCMGSGLCNNTPGYGLHTTLFQNSITAGEQAEALDIPEDSPFKDCLGNVYYLAPGSRGRITRSLQSSYAEDGSGANEGWFETAYLEHGDIVEGGAYEYLMLVQPEDEHLPSSGKDIYTVLSATDSLHMVKDHKSGKYAAAVFSAGKVGDMISYASPCVMIWDSHSVTFSNPDLALYSGEADELFDSNGKRIERSVYSRPWTDRPCGQVSVELRVKGNIRVTRHSCPLEISHKDGQTIIIATTSQAQNETIEFENE